jgi:DNA-binding transcriptional LysR family regulator
MTGNLNLKEVEAFRAVMLCGSMTAAAHNLHTSQPNISRLIARLEKSLRLKLFERINGRLAPTDEGAAFYREVERTFIGLKDLSAAANGIRESGNGRLRIAAAPSLALGFLPRVAQRFMQARPNVAMSIHTNTSATVEHWTTSHFCDLGLTVALGEGSRAVAELLGEADGVCILPPGHRLAARPVIIPTDLQGETFIALSNGDGIRPRIDAIFKQAGVELSMPLDIQYAAAVCAMVGLGLGVSIVSPIVVRDYLHTGIAVRQFVPGIRFPAYLLSPPQRARSLLADQFAQVVRSMLTEEIEALQQMTRP